MNSNSAQYLFLTFFLFFGISTPIAQPVINEILASNLNYSADNYGDYDDLIEIHNPTNYHINLAGFFLSDDENDLTKWVFPENNSQCIIAPNGYLVLWADGEPEEGPNHLPFSLDKNGESVILTNLDGSTIIDHINFDYQMTNVSFGRDSQDINEWVYFENPSFGHQNSNGLIGILAPPEILNEGGYFNQNMTISLSNANLESDIYYTLNTEMPSEESLLYEDEIFLDHTSVVSARSFQNNFIPSYSNSQLYINNIEESFSLPVLAILTDPDNLWDDSLGIYTNYLEEGVNWEKRSINQYFSNDSLLFSLPSGIRIQGRSSRIRPKKSFRLFFKNAYDSDRLNYPFFGNDGPISFKNIVLRSGYDDDIQMSNGTLIRDPLVSSIWEKLGMLTSRGIFSNLFINDQYWGIYNIRESINEHFISEHTGYLDFDLIRYLKNDFDLKFGNIDKWNSFNSFIRNTDFSLNENYEEAVNQIDMENFLNLQALVVCTGYWSWGWGVSAYRENNPEAKWKWTIWDMDRAFSNINWNGFTFLEDTTGQERPNTLPFRLLKNDQFKHDYINRISDFYNSIFKTENLIGKIDSLEKIIEDDIYFEAVRWDGDTLNWRTNVQVIRYHAINRPDIVKQQMSDYFSLESEGEIIIDSSEGGYVKVNSLSVTDFPWSGSYFKNIPISIEAISYPGYVFNGWNHDANTNSNPLNISLQSNTTNLNAVFVQEGINNELKIISPSVITNDEFHPVVFKYYSQGNLRMDNDPIIGNLYINDVLFDSAVVIKKGVGTYLLSINNLNDPIRLKVDLNNEISDEIILEQLPESSSDNIFGIIPNGETVWTENSNKFISDDLIINGDLIIHQGSHVLLNEHTNIFVNGSINILGTEEDPVIFKSKDWSLPWGGIEFYNSISNINNCFFINAGADPEKGWAHTNTQPILFAKESSHISIKNSYVLYSPGKALGSITSKMEVDSTIISYVFMGGEFQSTYLTFDHSYMLNIPNDDGIFVDADNDGFHIDNLHPSIIEPSKIRNSFFITGKDDAIDHYRSRLLIENCWIEGWMNEGVAASGRDTVFIRNTISKNNNKGFEAGYGDPVVFIEHCLAIENNEGFRLGDNYETPNTGKMIITNSIAFNNNDNIKNYTNHLQGPLPNGINISYSMTNDIPYNQIETNVTGEPIFNDSTYRIHHSSIGSGIGTGGRNMGITDPNVLKYGALIINEIMYNTSPDYDSEDWVELYNPGEDSLNISEWIIKDDDDDHGFVFPNSFFIPGKSFLIVSKDVEEFHEIYSHDPSIIGDISFGFGSGDQVRIYSSIMNIVDSVEYNVNAPWPSGANNLGPSLELINLEDNSLAENWLASTNIGGTPGYMNNNVNLNVINHNNVLPNMIEVFQNYPNPFNPITNIKYTFSKDNHVRITVHDLAGKKVKTIIDQFQNAGHKYAKWNSSNDNNQKVASGMYFYTIKIGNLSQTKKMLLLK